MIWLAVYVYVYVSVAGDNLTTAAVVQETPAVQIQGRPARSAAKGEQDDEKPCRVELGGLGLGLSEPILLCRQTNEHAGSRKDDGRCCLLIDPRDWILRTISIARGTYPELSRI